MTFRGVQLCAVLLALAIPATVGAQICFDSVLLTVTETEDFVREVSLDDFSVIATHPIVVPGETVTGCTGIAVDPDPATNLVWLLLLFDAK